MLSRMSTPKLPHLVFVYGTLKHGQPNYDYLSNTETGQMQFVAAGQTIEKYPLVIASKFNIPFLLDRKDVGHRIEGEIYAVCDRKLASLDELENHPNFYVRREEPIETRAADGIGSQQNCWTYFLPKFKPHLLSLATHQNYDAFGEHGLKYVERYIRNCTREEMYQILDNDIGCH